MKQTATPCGGASMARLHWQDHGASPLGGRVLVCRCGQTKMEDRIESQVRRGDG